MPSRGNEPLLANPCSPTIEVVNDGCLPVVVSAAVVGDRVLRTTVQRRHSRRCRLLVRALVWVLEPLNDPSYFAQVGVDPEAGTVVWPGDIDLAPESLYEQARAHPLTEA